MTHAAGTRRQRPPRVLVFGAGPVGLEAALSARELGWDAHVYERGETVGHSVGRWGFVELFSPWKFNVSPLGLRALESAGVEAPDLDAYPTGRQFASQYLDPIARTLGDRVHTNTEVIGVTRGTLLKSEAIGTGERRSCSFRVLLRDLCTGEERYEQGDVVLDATGIYDQPRALGPGGLELPAEATVASHIDRHLPDLLGADRERYAGRSILLVGSGHSAATLLEGFLHLAREAPLTRVLWIRKSEGDPLPILEDDPLPGRRRLCDLANRIATSPPAGSGIRAESGMSIESIRRDRDKLAVVLTKSNGAQEVEHVDRVLALVGYRPNLTLARELQVHLCYATEGPMKLAAALLGAGAGGDCLKSQVADGDVLRTSEPNFFVIGAKSYGRRSDFLMRTGDQQVREVFRILRETYTTKGIAIGAPAIE